MGLRPCGEMYCIRRGGSGAEWGGDACIAPVTSLPFFGRSAIECELRHSHVMICNVHYDSLIIFNQHTGLVNVAENSGSVPGTRKGYHYISDPARPKM